MGAINTKGTVIYCYAVSQKEPYTVWLMPQEHSQYFWNVGIPNFIGPVAYVNILQYFLNVGIPNFIGPVAYVHNQFGPVIVVRFAFWVFAGIKVCHPWRGFPEYTQLATWRQVTLTLTHMSQRLNVAYSYHPISSNTGGKPPQGDTMFISFYTMLVPAAPVSQRIRKKS
jgi:hypothetical protein